MKRLIEKLSRSYFFMRVVNSFTLPSTFTCSRSTDPILLSTFFTASCKHLIEQAIDDSWANKSPPALTLGKRLWPSVLSVESPASRDGWSRELVVVKAMHSMLFLDWHGAEVDLNLPWQGWSYTNEKGRYHKTVHVKERHTTQPLPFLHTCCIRLQCACVLFKKRNGWLEQFQI